MGNSDLGCWWELHGVRGCSWGLQVVENVGGWLWQWGGGGLWWNEVAGGGKKKEKVRNIISIF